MSSASKSLEIKFNAKTGTYTAIIQSPDGDIYQEYQKAGETVVVYPDFKKSKPELDFVCLSSRVADGFSTPVSMRFFFNDAEITFNSAGKSDGLFAGLFELIRPSSTQLYWGLRIVDNLAEVSRFAPIVIRMVGQMTARAEASDLTNGYQASYSIPVNPYTGTAYRVTIKAGDGKAFNLHSPTDSCLLEAVAKQGNETLTKGLYYKWYRAANTPTGWEQITSATGKTLEVSAADVDCTRDYMVEVYNDSSMSKDNLLGYDFQVVIDGSDPYDIDLHPSPEDASIDEDESGIGSVTVTPQLVLRGTTTPIESKFYFTLKSASGVVLNTEENRNNTNALSTFTVTRRDCIKAGYGNISLTVQSVK